ncbi:protein S100-G [Rousettus aegyptiacus]|nr:protein S100-G [Rousettus aegyptiacus]
MKGKFQHQGGASVRTDYKSRRILLSPPHSCLILPAVSPFSNQDTKMSDKMSPKELKSIFEKYAAREGDPNQLSKEELMLLVQNEFPSLLKGPSAIEDLFKELDKNGDGEVSFEEFQVVLKKISQ